MLGNTLVLTISGVNKTLTCINPGDNYASEYYLRESTQEHRVRIRHSKAKDPNGVVQDRHNVEYSWQVFATSTTPAKYGKVNTTIQTDPDTSAIPQFLGISGYLTASSGAIALRIEGWES